MGVIGLSSRGKTCTLRLKSVNMIFVKELGFTY